MKSRPSKSALVSAMAAAVVMLTWALKWTGQEATQPPPGASDEGGQRTTAPQPPPAYQDQVAAANQPPAKVLPPDELFKLVSPSVFVVETADAQGNSTGFGSGFLVSDDGLMVTNYHVINGAASIIARTSALDRINVTGVVATDIDGDLALLQTNAKNQRGLAIGVDNPPAVGIHVYAIGSPLGLANSMSDGIISGVRDDNGLTKIQTTAPISHGSSGGPLLTADARVIGVTEEFLPDGQNLNQAVPASRVRRLIANRGDIKPLAVFTTIPKGEADEQTILKIWDAVIHDQVQEASNMLAEIQDRQKDNSEFWYLDGCIQEKSGRFEIAISDFRDAIRLGSREPKAVILAEYYALGSCYSEMRQYDDAAEAYSLYTSLAPDIALGWNARGNTAMSLHHLDEAERFYEQALTIRSDSENAQSYLLLGFLDYVNQRPYAALRDWQTAIRLDPTGTWGNAAKKEIQTDFQ